jgi:hypothetical protein
VRIQGTHVISVTVIRILSISSRVTEPSGAGTKVRTDVVISDSLSSVTATKAISGMRRRDIARLEGEADMVRLAVAFERDEGRIYSADAARGSVQL